MVNAHLTEVSRATVAPVSVDIEAGESLAQVVQSLLQSYVLSYGSYTSDGEGITKGLAYMRINHTRKSCSY